MVHDVFLLSFQVNQKKKSTTTKKKTKKQQKVGFPIELAQMLDWVVNVEWIWCGMFGSKFNVKELWLDFK